MRLASDNHQLGMADYQIEIRQRHQAEKPYARVSESGIRSMETKRLKRDFG
jgi:hypothetical protein